MTSLSALFARSKPAVESILALAFPLLILLSSGFCSTAHAQDHTAHDMHAAMSMPMEEEMDSAMAAKLLADKRESEFNHHLAGFFVVLAGLFILAEADIRYRWPSVRYAWPLCFILSGFFVLICSVHAAFCGHAGPDGFFRFSRWQVLPCFFFTSTRRECMVLITQRSCSESKRSISVFRWRDSGLVFRRGWRKPNSSGSHFSSVSSRRC